jgi:agmatine deiminase
MANRMPAEWEAHERTWMAWPSGSYTLGDTFDDAQEARGAWAAVANAIVEFEPVTMVVDMGDVPIASAFLDDRIDIVQAPLDDAWMRDIGPTFVRTDSNELLAVDWVFNGWGQQSWAHWEHDEEIAAFIAEQVGVATLDSQMVNEGGGIHVNGAGVVLVTETVQRGEGRNPDWSRAQVEAELSRTLGTTRTIWLERGLTRDYDEFGTRGHVDIVACFANESTVLVHDQRDPMHPDFEVSQQVLAQMKAEGFTVVPVPAPEVLLDDPNDPESWVDYSYINHYICNGAVILCAFNDPGDKRAAAILREVYPGREIVLVDARPLFARGGGIHCITQQQPVA